MLLRHSSVLFFIQMIKYPCLCVSDRSSYSFSFAARAFCHSCRFDYFSNVPGKEFFRYQKCAVKYGVDGV